MIRKNTDIVTRRIADETVLVPIRGHLDDLQCLFTTDTVGAFIWEKMETVSDEAELADEIVGEYDVERSVAVADLRAFLDTLSKAGLILD